MENSQYLDSMKLKAKKAMNKGITFFGLPANSILVIFGVLLLILTFVPLIYVVIDSFTVHIMEAPALGLATGSFTFAHWQEVFAGKNSVSYFWKPLGNSLLVSVLSCIFAIVFGGGVAYLITRTNMPFKKFISSVFIFPYIMPQWTLALFWKNFFISTNCAGGYMGELQALTGFASPEWLVYGAFPISLVLGLHYAPFAYILIGGILRNMDANLEEAATILNVPRRKIFTHITVPILKPALLSTVLLVFSSAMSSYPVATTLGKPINYQVLATQLNVMLQGGKYSSEAGMGAIISLILIAIGVVILMLNTVTTGSRKQYTTVSGKSGQVSKNNLGKFGKWVIAVVLSIIVLFFCIGPMISFIFESLLPNSGDYSIGFTTRWRTSKEVLRNGFKGVFYTPEIWSALGGSIALSLVCSLFAGTFGLLIGYAVSKKRKSKLAQGVNALAFLPYLLPSISLSAIFFMVSLNINWLYATPFLLCAIVGIVKYIPFASRRVLSNIFHLLVEVV